MNKFIKFIKRLFRKKKQTHKSIPMAQADKMLKDLYLEPMKKYLNENTNPYFQNIEKDSE